MDYDTLRHPQEGTFAHMSQTNVCDTCGSAPTASQRRMAPSRWTCSATPCGPRASATYSSSGNSTVSAATSPIWSTPCRICPPAVWACGCSPVKARGSTPPPQPAAPSSASSRRAGRAQGRAGARTQGRQEVRAVESPGAARPGREGAARHLRVRTLHSTRDQTRDALQVRRAAGPVARAGREGPRHLKRSASTATPRGHLLNIGFRLLLQTTRSTRRLWRD